MSKTPESNFTVQEARRLTDMLVEFESEGAHFDAGQVSLLTRLVVDGVVDVAALSEFVGEIAEAHALSRSELLEEV